MAADQKTGSRRLTTIGSIIAIIAVLGLIAFFITWLLGPSKPTLELEGEPTPGQAVAPSAIPRKSLAVTISFTRDPIFTLSIKGVTRSTSIPTAEYFRPLDDQVPFSIIRLRDLAGTIITEEKFHMSTQVIAEGESIEDTFVYEYPERDEIVVFSLPSNATPSSVELLSSAGATLQTLRFDYDDLTLPEELPLESPSSTVTDL